MDIPNPIPMLEALLLQAQEADTVAPSSTSFMGSFSFEPGRWIRTAVLLFVGLPLVYVISTWMRRWIADTSTAQRGLVVGKLLWYTGAAVVLVSALTELGFSLAPLLGAAGILGIALGFASQTSVSNVISGFFLMAEQPFVVDDIIQIGNTLGVVLSIDMMSVKLRTFDNKFVRIPNEQIIKSEVTTITRFPIRRVDVMVSVAYKEDLARVRKALMEVADANPRALMEPRPMIILDALGESSVNFSYRVWAARENWLELKNTILEDVKKKFDDEGIEIPFPHRTLYAGSATEAFPVRVVGEDPPPEGRGDRPDEGSPAEEGPDSVSEGEER